MERTSSGYEGKSDLHQSPELVRPLGTRPNPETTATAPSSRLTGNREHGSHPQSTSRMRIKVFTSSGAEGSA
jgi:hypothetical protein